MTETQQSPAGQRQAQLAAAQLLARTWTAGGHIEALPAPLRPATRADGYAVQALWPGVLGQAVAGWKIAATSKAGQEHIAVRGPIAFFTISRSCLGTRTKPPTFGS